MDAKQRKQPTTDKCSDNSDKQVDDETETGALDDLPGQPPGGEAHQ
jgi:hypothetical protein